MDLKEGKSESLREVMEWGGESSKRPAGEMGGHKKKMSFSESGRISDSREKKG